MQLHLPPSPVTKKQVKRKVIVLLLLLPISTLLFAQGEVEINPNCGISQVPQPDNSPIPAACSYVYDHNSCSPIFIAVNFHFFVNDDCSGNVGAAPNITLSQEEAFQEAENLLKRANSYNERIGQNSQWNQAFWGAPVTAPQCVPIRYITNEVFIHCDEDLKQNPGFGNSYWANSTTYPDALNTAISNITIFGSSVTGYTSLGARYVVIETFEGQNFHHEVGHTGSLRHTNQRLEACEDTPEIDWEYDYNGDGIVDENSFRDPCFDSAPFIIINGVQYDQCTPDGIVVVNPSPCCAIENRDNNTMIAGALAALQSSRAAMTPCQVETIIDDYIATKCDMIKAINTTCPPTSAHIGILPITDFVNDCKFTLYFEASMGDEEHRLTYELWEGGRYVHLFTTDWDAAPAGRRIFGVGRNRGQNGISGTLLSNADYRITLETRNDCGSLASHQVEFTTGDCDINRPDEGGVIFIPENNLIVYPNPTNLGSTLEYSVTANVNVDIYWSGIGTDGHYLPLQHHTIGSGAKSPGNYTVQFSNQQLKQGVNYIVIQANDEVHIRRVNKNQ